MSEKVDLRNLTFGQMQDYVKSLCLPAYRAKQIFSWLYRPGITDFSQMTDLSKDLRAELVQSARISMLAAVGKEVSNDGTTKFIFRLQDNEVIESVLIPEDGRYTLCISSQVGCAMGCRFCVTGTQGFRRNLSVSEIVNQAVAVNDHLSAAGLDTLHNLVFMGMGEPLANLDNVMAALDILLDQRGLDFSERKITVSTSGLVPKMRELGRNTKVNLAVSLHAVDDELRDSLMPVNKTYNLETLLNACREYPLPRRKRIMFEYILLKGVNDSENDAKLLTRKLHGIKCKINLLPYNESEVLPFQRSDDKTIARFQDILWQAGYTVIVRNSRGADISAACGQLAGKM